MLRRRTTFPLVICFLFGLSGMAGELVLRNGKRIATKGPWVIKDAFVEYKTNNGNLYRLPLKLVDQKRSSQEDPEPEKTDFDRVLAKVKEHEEGPANEGNIHEAMALEEDFSSRKATKITDEKLESLVTFDSTQNNLYGRSLLHWVYAVVGRDDVEALAQILQQGVPLNEKAIGYEDPILVYAARRGNPKIMKLLLKGGASTEQLSRENETPLLVTLSSNLGSVLPVTRMLLKYGANPNVNDLAERNPLQLALYNQQPILVGLLLEADALPNATTSFGTRLLTFAIIHGDLRSCLLLLDSGAEVNYTEKSGRSPLFFALERGNLAILEPLVKKGADLNQPINGITPLMIAIGKDQLELAQKFLQWGANPNLEVEGKAPYHLAVDNTNPGFLNALLKNGLNKALYPEVLSYAVQKGNIVATRHLLKAGVSAKATNQNGDPVLVLAARHGHLDVVSQLLRAGADVNQKSAAGYSAYVEAKGPDEAAIKDLIRSYLKK